jgi:hypothetical protein
MNNSTKKFVVCSILVALNCVPALASAADLTYSAALQLYGKKRYQEALPYFHKLVKANPKNSTHYLYLANCYYFVGNAKAATDLYRYILNYFPQTQAASSASQMLKRLEPGSLGGANKDAARPSAEASNSDSEETVSQSLDELTSVVRPRADRPPVSEGAKQAVKAAVDSLPAPVKNLLRRHSVNIVLTPTVEDYKPGVKYQEARGYEGGTYKSCPGFFDGSVVLAERTLDENDETVRAAFSPSDIVNTLYHECGHALDYGLGHFSRSDEFKHAYLLDSAKIEPEAAHEIRYYLQKSDAGQEECCAELIGMLLGQKERHSAQMRASFPLTIKMLRSKLNM